MIIPKEPVLVSTEFPFKDMCGKKCLEITAFNETFRLNWYTTSNGIAAKLHNVCVHGPKQVAFARVHSIDPLSWSEVQEGESEAEIFDSPWGQEKQLISAPKRRRAVMFRVMSWKTRGGLEQRGIPSPHKQTSKNKQFHPTEKETGQWDKREGQTGVREEWHLWQEGTKREAGGDERGWAGVFMKGPSDWLSPSFWPAGLVWILGKDFIFWSPSWIMYHTPLALVRAIVVSMILLFQGGSSPETHYLWKPF